MRRLGNILTAVSALVLMTPGCSRAVTGQVVDARSGIPIANATVEIASSGWGRSDGRLVFDKEHVRSAKTDGLGRFSIGGSSGGHRLTVRAPGFETVNTALCSTSPMLVRIGGVIEQPAQAPVMRLGDPSPTNPQGWSFDGRGSESALERADLAIASRISGTSRMTLVAPAGAAFVPGTGNPARVPKSGFTNRLGVDLLDCGWLYVRTRSARTAIVRTGSYESDIGRSGGEQIILSYFLL